MKITIVTGPFFSVPPAPCGAVERIWHDLAKEFAVAGHQVNILCRAWEGLPGEEHANGINYVRRTHFKRTGRIGLDLTKDMAYSLRHLPLLPQADILITNVFWLPILSRFNRAAGRLVINVQRYPKNQLQFYTGAARFAVVSTAVHDAIAQQFPAAVPRTRVIPNPIDLDIFTPPQVQRSHEGEQTILYTGRVHPEKGLHVLVDAFCLLAKDYPHLRLRIVGPSRIDQGGGGPKYLRQLSVRAGDAHVRFDEAIYDRRGLADALRAAHYYCYPSLAERGETFGVAALEAMATGLAPVVSDLACFRDFIEPGVNGYVFDHRTADPAQGLALTLRQLISNPAQTDAAGQQAAKRAQRFDCASVAALYLEDFKALLSSQSGQAQDGNAPVASTESP